MGKFRTKALTFRKVCRCAQFAEDVRMPDRKRIARAIVQDAESTKRGSGLASG